MEDVRKNALISLFKKEPHSVNDIATATGAHYVTAHKWVKELAEQNLIEKLPFPRGKETLWTFCANASIDEGVVRVQFKGGKHNISSFAQIYEDDLLSILGSLLAALYVRSYYADDPENQHLRGGYTPLEIKDKIRSIRAYLVEYLKLTEQIMLIDDLWVEGSKAHQIIGTHPDMENIMSFAQPVFDMFKKERTAG